MKIVRLTTRIYPDKAGPAVYAYFLSEHAADKKCQIYNITGRPDNNKEKVNIVNPFFKIYYLPIRSPRWDAELHKHLIFLIKFMFYSFVKIVKLHRKYRIDLIHCDNPAITGIVSILLNRIFRIPFIYTHHGLDSHFKLNFLAELRLIPRYSSYHIIVSRKMIPFFKKNKVNINKLKWIPIGIDLDKFFHVKNKEEKKRLIYELNFNQFIDLNDFIILYVGYMDLKQKVRGMIDFINGFNDFLETLEKNERERVKLIYLGDGKFRNLLENEVEKLELQNNVYLLGTTSEIEKVYAISDFSALTSYMEGFPISLLEAVASEVPCICTDVGEVQEIVDDNCIVSCGSRNEISNKLKVFYENKDLCKTVSNNSFQKIKKFAWDDIAKKIKQLYKKTIIESL
jgi:glycosyltransferase involved in cell wall biosynthesis